MDSRPPARTHPGSHPAGLLPAIGIALLLAACAADPDTNAPSNWRGCGTATIVDDDTLVHLDDSGIELTFVPGDGVKPDGCA